MRHPENSKFWPRLLRGLRLAFVAIALSLLAFLLTHFYLADRHYRTYLAMELAIAKLSDSHSADLTDNQWAYCIECTWNLHVNYGHNSYISTADLDRMATELREKIDAGPDRATIDWFWDEYMRSAPNSRNYQRFRPTSPENRMQLELGNCGETLAWWRSESERMSSKIVCTKGRGPLLSRRSNQVLS